MSEKAAHLRRYLSDYGSELPPDIDSFREGGVYSQSCIFCSNPHDLVPVYEYNIINGVRTATGANCCHTCEKAVSQMVREHYSDIYYEDRRNKQEVEFEDEKDSEYSKRKYKLNLYNTVREFDESLNKFILERNTGVPMRCYFCERQVASTAAELHVPVTGTGQVSGGRIKVCGSDQCNCYEEIWEFDTGGSDDREVLAKCSYCAGTFLITMDEFERERIMNSFGKHMCPTCVYQGIEMEQTNANSILYDPINRSIPYERFIHNECCFCYEPITIDLTYLHSRLKKVHTAPNNECRCWDCFVFKVTKPEEQYRFMINEFYCVVFYLDKKWSYRISKVVNNEEKIQLRAPTKYGVTEILEAITDAANAAGEFGTQIQIPYGSYS